MESSSEDDLKHDGLKANLNCRFYRPRFPKVDELVMVQVLHVDHVGANVSLLEYNNIEGLIMLTEMSRKRIRSVTKLTRVGRKEVVVVIRVDESKGYLDLSKKQVTPEDIKECEEKYKKGKFVNNILRHVAQTTGTDIEFLYESIGWPLYEKYEHALEGFRLAVDQPEKVLEGLQMTPEVKASLLTVIKNRLAPQAIKIRADFSVTCFEYEGIDAIKAALTAGMQLETEQIKIKIRLIAAPLYVMVLSTVDRTEGLGLANSSLRKIAEEIKARGGNYVLKEPPHVLETCDDHEVEEMLHKQGNTNKVISDVEEDNDETMGDVDIGIDTDEIDAKNAAAKDEDEEEEEKKG
jgi:translation initiation factor 2 subunit 1